MSANSSHWCKAVIEEVVQPVTGAPPPPNPPSYYGSVGTGVANNYLPTSYGIGTTSKPTVQTSIAGVGSINPQYLQMYQQYYQSASPTPSPVINNLNM